MSNSIPQKEKTLRELIKENQSRIWWEEEPTPNIIISLVIEWIALKKENIGNKIYSDHRFVAETIYDELLEELMK